MPTVSTMLVLLGALLLLGSDCSQDLFAPISCDDDAECEVRCQELCEESGDDALSAECDANGFCDCQCTMTSSEELGGFGGDAGSE